MSAEQTMSSFSQVLLGGKEPLLGKSTSILAAKSIKWIWVFREKLGSVDRSEFWWIWRVTNCGTLKLSSDVSNVLHPFLLLMALTEQLVDSSDRTADLRAVAWIIVGGLTPHSRGFLLGLHGSTVPGLSPTTSPIASLWRQPGTPVMHTDKRIGVILIIIMQQGDSN